MRTMALLGVHACIAVTAVLFLFVAAFYKERTYIQDEAVEHEPFPEAQPEP